MQKFLSAKKYVSVLHNICSQYLVHLFSTVRHSGKTGCFIDVSSSSWQFSKDVIDQHCWPIKYIDTKVVQTSTDTFESVDRCHLPETCQKMQAWNILRFPDRWRCFRFDKTQRTNTTVVLHGSSNHHYCDNFTLQPLILWPSTFHPTSGILHFKWNANLTSKGNVGPLNSPLCPGKILLKSLI